MDVIPTRKLLAPFIAGLLVVVCWSIIIVSCDLHGLDGRVPSSKGRRAAVAIRDKENPFLQWITHVFTWPYLSQNYDDAYYLTESSRGDKMREFKEAVQNACEDHEAVDIFLLSHGNEYYRWIDDVADDHRTKLRLVYNTGCYNLSQSNTWLQLGAKTYVGHPGKSVSPLFYVQFMRRWTKGYDVGTALKESNARVKKLLFRGAAGKTLAACLLGRQVDVAAVWQDSKAGYSGNGDMSIDD